MRTLIKHGLIVDPASHVHSKNNLLVEDGRIQGLTAEEPEADVILDAEGMVVSPGFVDIHMHEDPYDPEEGRLIPMAASQIKTPWRRVWTSVKR